MKLTPQHHKAIEALAMGENNKSVAEKLNIAPETISRWRADFDFQATMNAIIEETQKTTKDRLRYLSSVALETIENVMLDSEAPQATRVSAAFKVLELTRVRFAPIGSQDARVLAKRQAEDEYMNNIGL